jgi:hypothetical protein
MAQPVTVKERHSADDGIVKSIIKSTLLFTVTLTVPHHSGCGGVSQCSQAVLYLLVSHQDPVAVTGAAAVL